MNFIISRLLFQIFYANIDEYFGNVYSYLVPFTNKIILVNNAVLQLLLSYMLV